MVMSGQDKDIWTHKRHPVEDRLLEEVTKVLLEIICDLSVFTFNRVYFSGLSR